MLVYRSEPTQAVQSLALSELRPVAWVGGAIDQHTRLLQRHRALDQQYFQWFQYRELADWLQAQARPALVIGHSYGACTAAAVVASGMTVAELVTIESGQLAQAIRASSTALCWPLAQLSGGRSTPELGQPGRQSGWAVATLARAIRASASGSGGRIMPLWWPRCCNYGVRAN